MFRDRARQLSTPSRIRGACAALALATGLLAQTAAAADDAAPDELLVGFRGGVAHDRAEKIYQGHGGAKLERLRGLEVHRVRVAPGTRDAVERALARHPEVKFVERNRRVAPDMIPNDPGFGSQWHLPMISAPQAWDVSTGRPEIVIAVLDTGVDPTHPDLVSKLVAGWNVYDNNAATQDVHGHGTWVAGVAAAASNNASGVTGVGVRNLIMPMRVTDTTGYAYYSTIANALTWAVDHGAVVMNVSFTGVAGSASIRSAASYVRGRGGLVVAAAGNCSCYDATLENPYLLSIGATTATDGLASFSSRGGYVDLSAPGESIYTTAMGGGYQYVSGTSFSSPIVAGVAALMLSANSTLTAAEVDQLLTTTADDRGGVGKDEGFGWGRVNAYRAVAAAAVSTPPQDLTAPTVAITSPAAGAVVTGSLVVTVDATDAGGIGRVDFYVDGVLQGSDTTAPYSFTWNSETGGTGARTLTAKGYDLVGNQSASAPVTVSVMAPTQDTTAPTVTIQSVSRQANKLRVAVSAVDDRSVSRIELYLDGALWASSTANPVVFSMNLKPLAAGTHGISARAYDPSGNARSTSATMFSK